MTTTTTTTAATAVKENIESLVAKYVKLRDRLKEVDDAHKEKTKPARELLEQLNVQLLAKLNELGGDSVKTPAGTCYRSTKRSATIADQTVFREYVIDNEAWDVVDWRANAPMVASFIESHGTTPPGVNFSTTYVVGVRRG